MGSSLKECYWKHNQITNQPTNLHEMTQEGSWFEDIASAESGFLSWCHNLQALGELWHTVLHQRRVLFQHNFESLSSKSGGSQPMPQESQTWVWEYTTSPILFFFIIIFCRFGNLVFCIHILKSVTKHNSHSIRAAFAQNLLQIFGAAQKKKTTVLHKP